MTERLSLYLMGFCEEYIYIKGPSYNLLSNCSFLSFSCSNLRTNLGYRKLSLFLPSGFLCVICINHLIELLAFLTSLVFFQMLD